MGIPCPGTRIRAKAARRLFRCPRATQSPLPPAAMTKTMANHHFGIPCPLPGTRIRAKTARRLFRCPRATQYLIGPKRSKCTTITQTVKRAGRGTLSPAPSPLPPAAMTKTAIQTRAPSAVLLDAQERGHTRLQKRVMIITMAPPVRAGVLASAVRAIHSCAISLPQMTSAARCWMLGEKMESRPSRGMLNS